MISLNQISLQLIGLELFKNISLLINQRDRIGLVGNNGSGKTTLLKILNRSMKPDEGDVTIPDDLTIGYLPQQMKTYDSRSVYHETISAFSEIRNLELEIEKISTKLAGHEDYNSIDYNRLIRKLSEKNEEFRIVGGINIQEEVEKTLGGLGFSRNEFFKPTAELSGGWRMRIELAKILLKKPGLILLDEPTNHLDIESIQWLELFLKNYTGAVVLVSHDKAFLDTVTNRTIELSLGRLYDYKVPYTKFVKLREERREQQLATFRNQQKMIEDTERFIERFRYKNTKAVQVQSRVKQLKKLERIEVEEEDPGRIRINFPPAPRSGTIVMECTGIGKSYDGNLVLDGVDLIIERGEKVAFVGKNGEGKTTLVRVLVGELEYKGNLKLGHNVAIGYYAQDQDQTMNENLTVFQTIDQSATGEIRTKMRSILGAFLFQGDDIDKKVKVLSGGERSRLALIKLLLAPHNLLILDEPTNHLDMRSKDILKQALVEFDGTLIVVSHDREFLDGLVEKIYEFRGRKVSENIGGIFDFLERRKIHSLRELESTNKKMKHVQGKGKYKNKKLFLARKESEKEIRKLRSKISGIEKEIGEIEHKLSEMDQVIADPEKLMEVDENAGFYESYRKMQDELKGKIDQWERVQLKLESLTGDL
ncbi:MAG: ATP-binding cassette domain-containing protein [Bacteroidales bacterium]|nr:MAG: ATP-binding cassette domain-containing protein [Bacteroidales bacterium]